MTPPQADAQIAPLDLAELAGKLASRRRVPVSTYRLQLHRGFTFRDAERIVPYLASLGITDVYLSPYLAANPGSLHGYDITDHQQLNPELGAQADFDALIGALAAHGLGHIVDFVPNHMGANPEMNAWWRDVLENGMCSKYARYFDIDWDPVKPELKGKVLLPILGDQYGLVLERGELRLELVDGSIVLRYFEHSLPIDPQQWTKVLEFRLPELKESLGEEDPDLREYLSITTTLRNLPARNETEAGRVAERERERGVARERLTRVIEQAPAIRRHLEDTLRQFNGTVGDPRSFDLLHDLLEAQAYRLAYWRTAPHEINYRRFFDVNTLAAVREEDPEVFANTHRFVLQLIREGKVTGLRIDHPDGLFDPVGYLEQLQEAVLRERLADALGVETLDEERLEALRAWRATERTREPSGFAARPCYVVLEKILSTGEPLPRHWAVDGTTGYEFLNELNGLFVDAANADAMRRVYERFIGRVTSFPDIVYESKRLIMMTSMASELNVLTHALNRISEMDRRTRDFTLNSLRQVLREVIACFPVYRTYIGPSGWSESDRRIIDYAINAARRRTPAMEASIFRFVRDNLLPEQRAGVPEDVYRMRLEFAMKFQQYTGPVVAKGLEDTASYRHHLLVSLNEVGGDPRHFGCSPQVFHEMNQARGRFWPSSLLTTSTHDTKRGEDVRARINVLSEIPDEWARHVEEWTSLNASNRTLVEGEWAPDANDEYLFYQTLIGAWPAPSARLKEYMMKAIKEAKIHTSWISDNEPYDRAVARFVEQSLAGITSEQFLNAFQPFQQRVARAGMINSLSQVVVKCAAPGVPDFYQGAELWNLNLVDPDNRRPVDFELRRRLLASLDEEEARRGRLETAASLLETWDDARLKLFVTRHALHLRAMRRALFMDGSYIPLPATGAQHEHLFAFARRHRGVWVIAAVPRLLMRLEAVPGRPSIWDREALLLPHEAPRKWLNVLTGREHTAAPDAEGIRLPASSLFADLPVALLESC